MTKKGDEFRSNFFNRNPNFSYISDKDKYLFHQDKPKYKFNVIGTGIMGQEHIRITMAEGRGTIHGLYDSNSKSVETAKGMFGLHFPGNELKIYDSLEKACNDPEVDGLIICTPNFTHLEMVKVAIKSGKHILLLPETLGNLFKLMRI